MPPDCVENFQVFSALPNRPTSATDRKGGRQMARQQGLFLAFTRLVSLPLTKSGTNEAPEFSIHFNHIRSFMFGCGSFDPATSTLVFTH